MRNQTALLSLMSTRWRSPANSDSVRKTIALNAAVASSHIAANPQSQSATSSMGAARKAKYA
ncbi:hypothetical protein I546_4458 [Mycobacterium kansasii 732]|nr:hypothetical protein I546_4458 [Mycobacterium kansasii 732]